MSIIWFSLAQDADFELTAMGTYKYIGNEEYVEIPHIIYGDEVTSINGMFYANRTIKGVKSTNKNIESMVSAFAYCKTDELNLSEFDASQIDDIRFVFWKAKIKNIIFPETGFPRMEEASSAFEYLQTDRLDLSAFDFSRCKCYDMLQGLNANRINFPRKGIEQLLYSNVDFYCPLLWIPANSQTEELCWQAILLNKRNGIYARIKSKKILMYLGTDYLEYASFYYSN